MNFGTLSLLSGGFFLGIIGGRLHGVVVFNPQIHRALGLYASAAASMLHLFSGIGFGRFSHSVYINSFLFLSSKRKEPVNNPI